VSRLSLRTRLYLFAFVDEFGPLYALYAIWFAANGLTATQISWIFLMWAGVVLVAEVPSGALADRMDRRHLIAGATLFRALGISTLLLWPTLTGILVGAALWAVHSSLVSGTWEALVYDLLVERGEEERYTTVSARIGQANYAGIAGGALLASAGLALGATIPLLGWLTVGAHVLSLATVLSLPEAEAVEDEEESPLTFAAWRETLRAGVSAATASPVLLRVLVLGAVIEGLFILDEYQPLLAEARGAREVVIPLLVMVVWVGLFLGGELAARRPRLSSAWVGGLLSASALLVLLALWSGSVWALAVLGVGYAMQNVAWVVSDARFQERAPKRVRATVTSVRAFLAALVNMMAFALVGLLSVGDDPRLGVMVLVGVLVGTGVLMVLWLPEPSAEKVDELIDL